MVNEIKITDIEGFQIGNAQNLAGGTGCTAILSLKGAAAGVDVRGSSPATRETDSLKPINMIEKIHGVMLSGGSAFGLDAAAGAMQYLEEKGIGFDVGVGVVPIVCGASLFDLTVGDSKCRPDKAMGYQACMNSETKNLYKDGNYGAGTGATIGKYLGMSYAMKSGLGSYAVEYDGFMLGAIVAVNALGDVYDVNSGKQIAGMYDKEKKSLISTADTMYHEIFFNRDVWKGNTTIGCILTNATLTKSQINKIAAFAHDGYARSIRPVHTCADGDAIFAMASGTANAPALDTIGTLAADVMARAVNNAIKNTESLLGYLSYKDLEEM